MLQRREWRTLPAYIIGSSHLPRIAGVLIVQGSCFAAGALLVQGGLAFLVLLGAPPSTKLGG